MIVKRRVFDETLVPVQAALAIMGGDYPDAVEVKVFLQPDARYGEHLIGIAMYPDPAPAEPDPRVKSACTRCQGTGVEPDKG